MLLLLPPLLLILHVRVRISLATHCVIVICWIIWLVLLLLGTVVLLLMVVLIVLLLLLLLLLTIAVTDPVVVSIPSHHSVGVVHIATTATATGICWGVSMNVLIGLQLYASSTPKVGIGLFLLPIAVGGLALGSGRRLL